MRRKVRSLTQAQYEKEAKPLLEKVFVSFDPVGQPISPSLEKRIILYPTGYKPEDSALHSFIRAMQWVGDEGFYVSMVEGRKLGQFPDDIRDWIRDWYVPLEDMKGYDDLTLSIETAHYSPTGKWAMLASHENFTIIAGSEDFIGEFCKGLQPTCEEQLMEFLEDWKQDHDLHGYDISWLQPLLMHVYGKEKAKRALQEAGLGV